MKRTGPPSAELPCDEILGKMQDAKLNLVFFGDFKGALFNTFQTIATENEKYSFWHVSSECANEFNAKHDSLAIFRTFDKSPLHLEKVERTQEAIQEWMEKSALPTLIDFANEYVEPVFKRSYPSIVLYTNDNDANYSKVFEEAAFALQGEILFVRTGDVQGI